MKHATIRISIVRSMATIKVTEIMTGEIAGIRCARLGKNG